MKVLLLGEMLGPSELASYRIRELNALGLAKMGHSVVLAVPNASTSFVARSRELAPSCRLVLSPGLAPRRFRRGGLSILDMFYKIWVVLTGKFDVVHTTCGHRPAQFVPVIVGRIMKRMRAVDEWWEWYGAEGRASLRHGLKGWLIGLYDSWFELPAKRHFDTVIAISSFLKRRLANHSNVAVVHGGAEVDTLRVLDRDLARRKVGIPDDVLLIGLTSTGEADHEDNSPFLEAFEDCLRQYSHLRVFVTGEKEYIEKRLLTGPSGDYFTYRGWLDLEAYNLHLSACDFFVLPLRNSPRNAGRWPNKIGDYLAVNRPVVSNPVGDLPELFAKYRIGVLCRNEGMAFRSMIDDVVSGKADLSVIGAEARNVAEDVLAFRRRTEAIEAIYLGLMDDRE